MKNKDIIENLAKLNSSFVNSSDVFLPVKLNFFIQKNKQKLIQCAKEIEDFKMDLGRKYGNYSEETNGYSIKEEYLDLVAKELNDLAEIDQDIKIEKVNINALSDDLKLTFDQMDALMFMIEEKEE